MIGHLLTAAIARVRADEALQQESQLHGGPAGGRRVAGHRAGPRGQDRGHQPGLPADHRLRPRAGADSGPSSASSRRRRTSTSSTARCGRRFETRAALKFDGNLLTKDGQRSASPGRCDSPATPRASRNCCCSAACPASTRPTQSLAARAEPEGKELRASPRRSFQYRQMIAPVMGGGMPSRTDFFEVDCCDISAGGLSFFLDHVPGVRQTDRCPGQTAGGDALCRGGGPLRREGQRRPAAVPGGMPFSRPRRGVEAALRGR